MGEEILLRVYKAVANGNIARPIGLVRPLPADSEQHAIATVIRAKFDKRTGVLHWVDIRVTSPDNKALDLDGGSLAGWGLRGRRYDPRQLMEAKFEPERG